METKYLPPWKLLGLPSPHSLGTLIEWKLRQYIKNKLPEDVLCPHSLGTLIEWKLRAIFIFPLTIAMSPHSLGTLIEWKHELEIAIYGDIDTDSESPLAGDIN
jgi:hypothetical protein